VRPDVPIIIITAYGDAETKRKALEGGAEAMLTKPIDFATLRRPRMKSPTGTYDEPKQKWDPPAPTVERFRREAPR
jgi:FixJ family two-component response regulator